MKTWKHYWIKESFTHQTDNVNTLRRDLVYTQKRRGSSYLLPVPRIEAFALPNPVRTSNAEAHVYAYRLVMKFIFWKMNFRQVNTHPWTSIAAMLFDRIWKLRSFYTSRTKRQINALIIYKKSLAAGQSLPLNSRSHVGFHIHIYECFPQWLACRISFAKISNYLHNLLF